MSLPLNKFIHNFLLEALLLKRYEEKPGEKLMPIQNVGRKMDKSKSAMGKMVRQARLEMDIPQLDLAKKAKMTQGDVSKIERGVSKHPDIRSIVSIFTVLNLDLNTLKEIKL